MATVRYEHQKGCYPQPSESSFGIWAGEFPWDGAAPLLMIQILLIVSLSYLLRYLLRPLRQPVIVSQMLSGIILGPTVLCKMRFFREEIFSTHKLQNLKLIGALGLMFYQFIIGLKTDLRRLVKARKKVVIIGLSSCIAPAMIILIIFETVGTKLPMVMHEYHLLVFTTAIWSPSSIIVIYALLSELKILNSKIGRLAVGSALIQTIVVSLNSTIFNVAFNVRIVETSSAAWGTIVALLVTISLVIWGIRPATIWIVKKTPKGKPLSEFHFLTILFFTIATAAVLMVIGHSPAVGAFYVGLILPPGPPLGSTFAERLEGLSSIVFFPVFVSIIGLYVDLTYVLRSLSTCSTLMGTMIFILTLKTSAVIAVCLFCGMTSHDSLTLAVILNAKGIGELANLFSLVDNGQSGDCVALLLFEILVVAAITGSLMAVIYKPSQRFKVHKRRTIHNSKGNIELRVVLCVHHVDSVPTSINLLEAMCTTSSSLAIYVLHLMQLVGSVDSILLPYREEKADSRANIDTQRIVNAFRTFQEKESDNLTVHPYAAISPYSSMYEDICSMALDTKSSMIIIPFHVNELHGSENQALRNVNLDVLTYVPCSAAILIGHGRIDTDVALTNVIRNVVAFFFGGPDDREVVSLAMHLSANPHVRCTVVRFVASDSQKEIREHCEEVLDKEILREFEMEMEANSGSLSYMEQVVHDGEELVHTIKNTFTSFDLLIVGRKPGASSSLTSGLSTWSEYPELGIIGDMLASSDSAKEVLTLVVQQQPTGKLR